eukprot:Hpha_TRINITY_DN15957_c1_g1::TRINITY_DN15957_c1_g1_i2::g.73200::m.73200
MGRAAWISLMVSTRGVLEVALVSLESMRARSYKLTVFWGGMAELIGWLRSQGGCVEGVAPGQGAYGRGLFATRPVAAGAEVVRVRQGSLLMSAHGARTAAGAEVRRSLHSRVSEELIDSGTVPHLQCADVSKAETVLLCLALLRVVDHPSGPWAQYAASLPTPADAAQCLPLARGNWAEGAKEVAEEFEGVQG